STSAHASFPLLFQFKFVRAKPGFERQEINQQTVESRGLVYHREVAGVLQIDLVHVRGHGREVIQRWNRNGGVVLSIDQQAGNSRGAELAVQTIRLKTTQSRVNRAWI